MMYVHPPIYLPQVDTYCFLLVAFDVCFGSFFNNNNNHPRSCFYQIIIDASLCVCGLCGVQLHLLLQQDIDTSEIDAG